MLSETARAKREREVTESLPYKTVASALWVRELKSHTKCTVDQSDVEEGKEVLGQMMFISLS